MKIDAKKIKIKYSNKRGEYTVKYGKSSPLECIDCHSREVYRCGKAVFKIGSTLQSRAEVRFYKKLKKKDAKYFPKLLGHDLKRAIVVQEFIDLDFRNRVPKKIQKIVGKLIDKYNLGDDLDDDYMRNWAINKKTGKPVIFDMGISS